MVFPPFQSIVALDCFAMDTFTQYIYGYFMGNIIIVIMYYLLVEIFPGERNMKVFCICSKYGYDIF